MRELDDAAVVAAVLAGDTEAFSVLVRRYRDTYTRFAARMLGDLEDADDALQCAFVRAYLNLDQCREPGRFAAWLYRIVINECRTACARVNRQDRRSVRGEGGFAGLMTEARISDVWLRTEIQRALDQLPPDQREAFLLKHVEELDYDEMMEITGARESALKMRVKRARERLQELLEGVAS
jgi:RNA polymerase sigma-70 factor (ECF subfamily)